MIDPVIALSANPRPVVAYPVIPDSVIADPVIAYPVIAQAFYECWSFKLLPPLAPVL